MIPLDHRQRLVQDIEQAHQDGARLQPACEVAGIDVRTLQRWRSNAAGSGIAADRRPDVVRPVPAHALTQAERQEILRVANEPRFADMPPARIVPMLADEGRYIASESSFARVLRAHGQNRHRGRCQAPRPRKAPSTHIATAPNQVWCWDVTYLPSPVAGRWFYLYLIMDLYSRCIVGWEVHDSDSSEHAVQLLRRTALAQGIAALPQQPVLHGDNGSTLKATTVLAMLQWLGIKPSYSRPRVSDDNAFVESLFKTAKYRPEFPAQGMQSLAHARQWAAEFAYWYNHVHRHSGIQYVTPHQRHTGQDIEILRQRSQVYEQAKQAAPARWSRHTRNWRHIDHVALNPERISITDQKIPIAA